MQEEGTTFGDAADKLSGRRSQRPAATAIVASASATSASRSVKAAVSARATADFSASPRATCLAKAMMVIIGLTPTEVGKREASAT